MGTLPIKIYLTYPTNYEPLFIIRSSESISTKPLYRYCWKSTKLDTADKSKWFHSKYSLFSKCMYFKIIFSRTCTEGDLYRARLCDDTRHCFNLTFYTHPSNNRSKWKKKFGWTYEHFKIIIFHFFFFQEMMQYISLQRDETLVSLLQ